MSAVKSFFLFVGLSLCFFSGCSVGSKDVNDRYVERLRQQLLQEKFDEVYDESSDIVRGQLTRSEFVDKLRAATVELKSIDKNLNWQRDGRGSPEPAVYREDNWSSLNLEKDGRNANVQLDWDPPFDLCGMSISGDIREGGIRVFRNCD